MGLLLYFVSQLLLTQSESMFTIVFVMMAPLDVYKQTIHIYLCPCTINF